MMLGFDPKFVIFTHWSEDEKWAQESFIKILGPKNFSKKRLFDHYKKT